jgi:hypothetical protein
MVSMIRMLPRLVFVVALCVGATAATAQAETPSATVSFETAEASSSMKAMWIGCTVFFQGKPHECSVSGLESPEPGMNRVAGLVYDLKDLSTLAGTYQAVGPDVVLGSGFLRVKNDKGVIMTLWTFKNMQELQVPDSGMKIELTK